MSLFPKLNQAGPFKDILVHVPSDDSAEGVIGAAISIGRLFTGHIDGIIAVEHCESRQAPFDMRSTGLEVIADFENTMRTATHWLVRFETAAQEASISYGKQLIADRPDLIDQTLARLSRLYDLSIFVEPRRPLPANGDFAPRAMLFDSGRPVILVPQAFRGGIKLDRIAICWDGGRYAARAVHDAMPLLESAHSIDIIAVNEESELAEPPSEALASHLARRRLQSRVRRLNSNHLNIHKTILSVVADAGSGLVVMGGYGHSKAGRFVLGGVTRDALGTGDVPLVVEVR